MVWRLNDQSVHINETFKCYCMILHQNQQYTNRKCASTHSETVSLSNVWYNSNTNNFSICQCGIQIFPMISIRFKKCICYINFGRRSWLQGLGWRMCFLLIATGLVQMLGVSCVVCNNILFLHSFNNLNLIFTTGLVRILPLVWFGCWAWVVLCVITFYFSILLTT